MNTEYDFEAASLCGSNQDPSLVRFARKCFDAGYAKAKAEAAKEEDPYESEEYQGYVAGCVPLCHCDERYKPCDGILAGGICDGLRVEEDDFRDYDYDDYY